MKGLFQKKNLTGSSEPGYRSYRKKYILLLPLFWLMIFAASSLFVNNTILRITVSSIMSFFPWNEVVRRLYHIKHKSIGTQILVLLQIICTGVSSGYSVERSFLTARDILENTFGKKSILSDPLYELENDIRMHMDITESLDRFARKIRFSETAPVFHALAISSRLGNNALPILRSSCQMLSDLNSVQEDIRAENAGKNAEAVILCVMPFFITAALGGMGGSYLDAARDSNLGTVLLTAAFILAITASALLFRFMSHSSSEPGNIKNSKRKENPFLKRAASFIIRLLPGDLTVSRIDLFSHLSIDPNGLYEKHIESLLILFPVSTFFTGSILILSGGPVWASPLGGVIICILKGYDVRRKVSLRKEEIMKDVPLFFCLITTLLESGLQLPKAIDICAEAFDSKCALSDEIKNIKAMILSGITASDAVERFSLRIQIPEAQSALLLMGRYGRSGTGEVLDLLSVQASSCWNLCRNAARKKQEREALGLLFPMMLDFICVLIVATTPAIISMSI